MGGREDTEDDRGDNGCGYDDGNGGHGCVSVDDMPLAATVCVPPGRVCRRWCDKNEEGWYLVVGIKWWYRTRRWSTTWKQTWVKVTWWVEGWSFSGINAALFFISRFSCAFFFSFCELSLTWPKECSNTQSFLSVQISFLPAPSSISHTMLPRVILIEFGGCSGYIGAVDPEEGGRTLFPVHVVWFLHKYMQLLLVALSICSWPYRQWEPTLSCCWSVRQYLL